MRTQASIDRALSRAGEANAFRPRSDRGILTRGEKRRAHMPHRVPAPFYIVVLNALLTASFIAACSGDDAPTDKPRADGGSQTDSSTPSPPVSDSAKFLSDYASSVCGMYEPCCESEGLGYERGGCTEWFRKVTAAYFRGEYNPDAAGSCLEHLADVRQADPQRCGNVLDFNEATLRTECQRAFAAERDGKTLGEKCLLASDCATAPGGDVICNGGRCFLERHGSAGDGPCYIGGNSGIEGTPTEAVRCEAKDGLYCHRSNNVCTPQVDDGEFCPFPGACKDTAICTGGTCVALPAEGESCLNAIPGAGGFCRAGSSCDVATLKCGAALEEGAACREPAQCASLSCMGGKCTKAEFTRALNCTGKQ
jgi:hypothetical protein